MRSFLIALMCCISFSAVSVTPQFAVGQKWAYKTRPGEEQSTLVIDKVEDDPRLGRIYHISVSDVRIKLGSDIFANALPHLPVSLETLKLSCTTLLGEVVPNEQYLPGYRLWKEAHDAGHAGIYTISVAEIVTVAEKTLQKPAAQT
jgi:hypothetical protein